MTTNLATLPESYTPQSTIKWQSWGSRLVFYLGLLLFWEGVARSGMWPSYVLPGPSTVLMTLQKGIMDGLFIKAAWVSMQHILIGYSISVVVGLVFGLLLGQYKFINDTLGSLVMGLQALPSVCWLPLAIIWFGLNERAIVFVVVMGALFSIILGVEGGVRNIPPQYLKAARNLGASGLAIYTQVMLPAALPTIISGLKQGWSFAWRSLMAAELLYYSLSLGNLLQTGRDLNDAALVMAVMVVIISFGVCIDRFIFSPIENRVRERWGLVN